MDLNGRGKGVHVPGTWLPATPSKPTPTRPPHGNPAATAMPNLYESLGMGGFPPDFFQGTASTSNGGVNKTTCVNQGVEMNSWEAALAGKDKTPYEETMNSLNSWNNVSFQELLAFVNRNSTTASVKQREVKKAATRPYFPFALPENSNNQLQTNSANMFMEQNYSIALNQRNGGNQPRQMPQYVFPVPYSSAHDLGSSTRMMYDLNSAPATISDAVSNGSISFQCAPSTPDKGHRMQQNQLSESSQYATVMWSSTMQQQHNQSFESAISNDNASLHFAHSTSDDMRSKRQHNQLASLQFAHTASDDILSTVQNNQLLEAVTNGQIAPLTPDKANQTSELINNVQDERTAQEKGEDELPKGSSNFELHSSQESCSALENPVVPTENHRPEKGDENGIDLNKTPQQKPRRKKHRPKVVVEGKPKRTPKSAVKQNSMKEKQEKRKQNGMKETERVKRKYVRRKSTKTSDTPSDDYVVEGTNDANQSNDVGARSCKRSLNFDLEGQGHESQCTTQIHTETPPSIHKISRAYDQCTNNEDSSGTTTLLFSHGLERNSLAGIALDMNRDVGQQIVDYIELPDINPHPTRREVLRQNLKVLARDGEYQSNANHVLKNHKDSSMLYGISQVSKRAHLQTDDEGQFSLKAFQEGMLFPEIYKKRRTTTSTNSKLSTSQWNTSQHSSTTSQLLNGNCIESLRNGSSTSVYCSPSVPGEHLSQMQNTPVGAHPDRLNSSSELMLTIRNTEMKTGKRSKVHTRVRDFATLTTVTQCNNLQSPVPRNAPASHAPASHDRGVLQVYQRTLPTLSVNKYSRKRSSRSTVTFPNITEMKQQKDHAAISAYGHYPAKPGGTSLGVKGVQEVVQKSNSSIDDLVRGLECLSVSGKTNMVSRKEQSALVPFSINGDSNMVSGNQQTTLVPFKGDDRMVPYRGIFDPTKKRKPRPKVDINQETDNMYKLVMYNIPYKVEDAYWKSERRIMLGRANSFIARMHLIQGDRGFTPWRGSVLDSVIGVFLTQNVSDHLSSSAFMSLVATFPLKPTSNDKTCHEGELKMYVEEPDVPILDSVNIKWRESMPPPEPSRSQDTESSITVHETNDTQDKEVGNITESFGSNTGGGCSSGISDKEVGTCGEPLKKNADILTERCAGFVGEDGRILEVESSGVSPQTSAGITSCSDSNSEEEDLTRLKPNENSSSFMQLLHTTRCFQHFYNLENESLSIDLNTIQSYNQPEPGTSEKILNLDRRYAEDRFKFQHIETPTIPSSNCCLQSSTEIGVQDMHCPELIGVQILSSPPLTNGNEEKKYDKDMSLNAQAASVCNPDSFLDRQSGQPSISLEQEACLDKQPNPWKYIQPDLSRTCELEGIQSAESEILNPLAQRRETRIQQASSDSPDFSGETLDVVESTTLIEKKSSTETTDAESIRKEKAYSSILSHERSTKTLKPVAKLAKEKSKTFDWDSLRKEAYQKCGKREQNDDTLDSLDWEAVRCADVNEIAKAIKERGMNNMLAERIKDFLNRLVREHGSLNLEWLRDVPPEKAKEYLLSVRGLGLKSVECVRLLTLHHVAFPVDTNVGRIAVRLGWVPLQPLPESLQLHLLEMYPVLESIQKYLWPRLFKLDQRTLYELHYQMITFGKVFCTKSKPNCNACPMRADCRHFASAFAREKLLLPGPEEKGIVSSTVPSMANQTPAVGITTMSLPPPEANKLSETIATINNREPIIEVPASPEPECNDITESDIEDAFFEDPDEIPVIKLNIECFAQNLQNYMQENNMELQDAGLSKTLVTLNPEAASIPTPKLKNVNRLRTEHQVYELPDSHPLLKGVERRFPGDVSSYLLAIWTPGETAESIEPPERCCSSQMSGSLCNEETCFSCNSTREANSQTVRGTLLIPCKTAMRGSFPLNGTYFQVNEVFADHESSLNPIDVPRAWLWNLPKRTVYFGTSIPSIFKGQTTEQIQSCFWKGYVCVRGFDRKTRAPRPLIARLHFPASRLAVRTKAKKDE